MVNEKYSDFLQLCEHVECMIEKSIATLNPDNEDARSAAVRVFEDDMRTRSLRDANRSPSPNKRIPRSASTPSHYIWKGQQRHDDKFSSHFFPMREHDLVRDDLAVRRLMDKAKAASGSRPRSISQEPAKVVQKPPPYPRSSSMPRRTPRPGHKTSESHLV